MLQGALNVCFVVLFCTMLAGTVLKLCTVLVQREEFKIYVQQSFLCKNWGYNQIVRRKVSQSKYQQFFIHLTCDLILVHNSWFCFLGFPGGSYAVNWALTINCERLLFHFYFKMTSSAMKLLAPWCVQVVSVPSCRLAHFVLYIFLKSFLFAIINFFINACNLLSSRLASPAPRAGGRLPGTILLLVSQGNNVILFHWYIWGFRLPLFSLSVSISTSSISPPLHPPPPPPCF